MIQAVWFVCTARNAIVVIFCLCLAAVMDPDIEACMEDRDNCTFTLTGRSGSCSCGVLELYKGWASTMFFREGNPGRPA